jgi:FkbM family methyltransferase
MDSIKNIISLYKNGEIDKQSYISLMHKARHSILFEYSDFIELTNIKKIEIEDGCVIMTSRDRGIRIKCPPLDYRIAPIEILNFFDYEKCESKMMENLISEGDYFFDIGANIGWYSINVAISRRNVRVFSFEPIPKTYEQLICNVNLNPHRNITHHNVGLSNQVGNYEFYYYPEGSGNASAENVTGRLNVEKILCNVDTLDNFVDRNNLHVDFIKCDVEGAELFVFQGGAAVIQKDKPIVFSEILRKWSSKFKYHPNEIFNQFNKWGYRAFTVQESRLINFYEMDDSTIETNFFFLHTEKHEKLIAMHT